MKLAEVADNALNDRAIVFGSLPPGGRDLDLLVRDHSYRAVITALEKRGAIGVDEQWALFTGCKVQSVDVVPASDWQITPGAMAALFEDSRPLPHFNHIRQPAPRHVLLILARRRAFDTRPLADKHRTRIEEALSDDRAGWASARSEAQSWRAVTALECLHRSVQNRKPSNRLLARARGEILGRSVPRGWVSFIPAQRRGRVIALSGLDGSGKSTQAAHLRETLGKLGMEAVVERNRITANPSLDVIAAPLKRIVRPSTDANGSDSDVEHAGHSLGKDTTIGNYVRSLIVAIANGFAHRRATARHLRNGRTVICDRYVLDSIVQLRDLYGPNSRFRLHVAAIRALSPKPSASYWLDVPPDVALARNAVEYTEAELTQRRALYEALYQSVGATRLDGTAGEAKLCESIAADCWPRL